MEASDSAGPKAPETPFDFQQLLDSLAFSDQAEGSESPAYCPGGASARPQERVPTPRPQASALDVAEYILRKQGRMSTMKLQKLVYYAQAWSLVWDEAPLFQEDVEAWANGPVIRELFNYHRGMFDIDHVRTGNPDILSQPQRDTIDAVVAFYGERPAQWLIDLSHSEEPWRRARRGLPATVRGHSKVSLESMAEYYSSLPEE